MVDTVFSRVKLGGGGLVPHIDISPTGATRLIKTDTFGAYIWANPSNRNAIDVTGMASTHEWCQLVTSTSMPPGDDSVLQSSEGRGCYDVGSAPSNPDRIYLVLTSSGLNPIFCVSDDRGATFTVKSIPAGNYETGGLGFYVRGLGRKMAVDLVDQNAVYIFTNEGDLHYTRNAGDTWTTVSTSIMPRGLPGHIAVDPSSSTSGGLKTRLYAATGTNGLYVSNNSGVNWTAVSGGPMQTPSCLRCDALGRVWMTVDAHLQNTPNNCWRYASSTWTHLSPSFGGGFHSIGVNPLNTNEIAAQYQSGPFTFSADNGATWTSVPGGTVPDRQTTDIPWLAATYEAYMSSLLGCYDPVTDGRWWTPAGIGVYYTNEVPSTNATWPTWTELTRGNDELIPNVLMKPPGRPLFGTFWDRAVFRFDDVTEYPTAHGPFMDVAIRCGWSIDYAKNNVDFLACVANFGSGDRSAYSSNGGTTWTEFATKPADVASDLGLGGAIAVSTSTNMCWFPANNANPAYTTNGGATWTNCTFPAGIPTTPGISYMGWSNAYYVTRTPAWADKVTIGTFYAYNCGLDPANTVPSIPAVEGFYRSTDGGANWTKRGGGVSASGTNSIGGMGSDTKGECVPGYAGHFFWATGRSVPNPYDASAAYKILIFSDDGGTNAYHVTGFTVAISVGFGMAAPGHSYPTIFVVGWRLGATSNGVYRCSDWDSATRTGTWTRVAEDYGSVDVAAPVCGDMDEYGTVYVGVKGSGVIMGRLEGAAPVTTFTLNWTS